MWFASEDLKIFNFGFVKQTAKHLGYRTSLVAPVLLRQ